MSFNSSSNSSLHPDVPCIDSEAAISLCVCITTKFLLLLPLSVLVFYLGHQRWRKQRSFAAASHSEIFTLNMAAMETLGMFGSLFFFCGRYFEVAGMAMAGFCLYTNTFFGDTSFHMLTCVERYLAVVHPVTYMGLRQAGGVRIRNAGVACVWLSSVGWSALTVWDYPDVPIVPYSCLLIVSLVLISFCSLSVLCVLIRPGPGDGGGGGGDRDRERVDRSKRRAFTTISAIMGVLCLGTAGCIVSLVLSTSTLMDPWDRCVLLMSGVWFNLPSSLVLPLLFLHRAGKLPFCGPGAG